MYNQINEVVKKMQENGADIKPFLNGCDEVFIIKNFFSSEELLEIQQECDLIDWTLCKNSTSEDVKSFLKYSDRFRAFLKNSEYTCKDLNNVIARRTGQGMPFHSDITNSEAMLRKIQVDKNFTGEKLTNGQAAASFVIYFNNNYEGGEICYPEYNIEYQPMPGDILLHPPGIIHGVKKVKSGIRYTHQNVLDVTIYLDAEKARQLSPLDENIKNEYNINSPVVLHERLKKFKDTYKEENLY